MTQDFELYVRVRVAHPNKYSNAPGAVADEAVALHLAEPESALVRAALERLARQLVHASLRARVDLVRHHVLQALVEERPHVHLDLKRASRGEDEQLLVKRIQLLVKASAMYQLSDSDLICLLRAAHPVMPEMSRSFPA